MFKVILRNTQKLSRSKCSVSFVMYSDILSVSFLPVSHLASLSFLSSFILSVFFPFLSTIYL